MIFILLLTTRWRCKLLILVFRAYLVLSLFIYLYWRLISTPRFLLTNLVITTYRKICKWVVLLIQSPLMMSTQTRSKRMILPFYLLLLLFNFYPPPHSFPSPPPSPPHTHTHYLMMPINDVFTNSASTCITAGTLHFTIVYVHLSRYYGITNLSAIMSLFYLLWYHQPFCYIVSNVSTMTSPTFLLYCQ